MYVASLNLLITQALANCSALNFANVEKPGVACSVNHLPFNRLRLDGGLHLSYTNLIETSPAQ
jgi:hypothetical protein